MSEIATTLDRHPINHSRGFRTFDRTVNDYGTFISGYPWDLYGCGTYRYRTTKDSATRLLHTYFDRLRKSLKTTIAWLAVPENRTSGCGLPESTPHWHFVMAAPPQHRKELLVKARSIWEGHHGNSKIVRYKDRLPGTFYLAKTAYGADFDYCFDHLDRLTYIGPTDLFAYAQTDPYVPEHVKHLSSGRTLVMR
jgi:hypothetical protein